MLEKVQAFLHRYAPNVTRLALRPDKPHLFVRINLRLAQLGTAEELFTELKSWGE
jgi:hypothetical protein